MEYSNSIKIHEVEPVYYSAGSRAEFRLQAGKLYTNSLKLVNMGVTKSAAQSIYNKVAGVAGCVRSLTLLDGNVELQQLTRANEWAAIKHSFKSNKYNEDLGAMLELTKKSSLFNLIDSTGAQTGAGATAQAAGARDVEGVLRDPQALSALNERDTARGQMELSTYMGFLQSVNYLDTSIHKDLRLVVEYDIDMLNIFFTNQNNGAIQSTRPLLVVEEIVDPEIVSATMGKPPKSLSYRVIESDIMSVPAITTGVGTENPVQPQTFHIHGFSNKSVDRVLVKTRARLATAEQANNTDVMYGRYNSHEMLLQKNQLRVNGMNVYARSGIENSNERLALLSDVWAANSSIMPFMNSLGFKAADAAPRAAQLAMGNEQVGSQSYFCADLAGEKVKDLQMDYQRTGFRSSVGGQIALCKYNAPLDLIMFAEVQKAIIYGADGSYNVVYV